MESIVLDTSVMLLDDSSERSLGRMTVRTKTEGGLGWRGTRKGGREGGYVGGRARLCMQVELEEARLHSIHNPHLWSF
eukprot:5617249-Prymnesium_polylepis.2